MNFGLQLSVTDIRALKFSNFLTHRLRTAAAAAASSNIISFPGIQHWRAWMRSALWRPSGIDRLIGNIRLQFICLNEHLLVEPLQPTTDPWSLSTACWGGRSGISCSTSDEVGWLWSRSSLLRIRPHSSTCCFKLSCLPPSLPSRVNELLINNSCKSFFNYLKYFCVAFSHDTLWKKLLL